MTPRGGRHNSAECGCGTLSDAGLTELRLPTIKRGGVVSAATPLGKADRRAALSSFCSSGMPMERSAPHTHPRLLSLPADERLESFDFCAFPMLSKAHVRLSPRRSWIEKGDTFKFRAPGAGKTHPCLFIGSCANSTAVARLRHWPPAQLVQRLQALVVDLRLPVNNSPTGSNVPTYPWMILSYVRGKSSRNHRAVRTPRGAVRAQEHRDHAKPTGFSFRN